MCHNVNVREKDVSEFLLFTSPHCVFHWYRPVRDRGVLRLRGLVSVVVLQMYPGDLLGVQPHRRVAHYTRHTRRARGIRLREQQRDVCETQNTPQHVNTSKHQQIIA